MGLVGLLAKTLGKKIGTNANKVAAKSGGPIFTGIHPPSSPKVPLGEKIAELKTDRGLCESYVTDLIKQARGDKSLTAIKQYLESNRNDLPYNVTVTLLRRIGRKLDDLKKAFAEVDWDEVGSWFV